MNTPSPLSIVLAALALLAGAGTANAELAMDSHAARDESTPPTTPNRLFVGVYVNHIYGIDIKASQFSVDFYIWFRWDGNEQLKPIETFELANGRITSKTGFVKRTNGTQHYVSCRVLATITKFWDLRRFPLDDHTLEIEIEDSDQDIRASVFESDTDNASYSPDLQVPGWVILGAHGRVVTHTYHTNYGDISLPHDSSASYSQYTFGIDVHRSGYSRFLKVFFGLFISVMISWCGFYLAPKDASSRVSLCVGATFAAAAVTLGINSSLPDTNSITMADQLIMLTLGIIVASLVETIIALALIARNKEVVRRRLDRVCAICFPLFYLVMLLTIMA
jgi:hypothetical protein